VGLGSIGQRHVRLARELNPNARIIVLRHRNCKDTYGLPIDHCVTSLDNALEFHPQAAVIANPATFHLEIAMALAKAGVHLLIEKPISNTSEGVAELIDVCRRGGITLLTGYNLRFLPSLRKFRELLGEGLVGRILSIRAETGQFLPSWRPGNDYRKTVSARSELGGGVLLELSHEIDYLRWLFGEVDWVSATVSKQSDLEIDVEDTVHLTIGFESEKELKQLIAVLNIDCIRQDTTRTCTVIGELGTLRLDIVAGSISVFKKGNDNWQLLFTDQHQRDDSYFAEWNHFLECLGDGSVPAISGEDGLAVLKIVDAARHSAVNGTRTSINYVAGNAGEGQAIT